MTSDVQQWRPSGSMRAAGGFMAVAGSALAGLLLYWGVKGEMPVVTGVVAAVGAAAFAAIGVGYLLRYRLALGGGVLTVVGLWRTYRVPLEHVVRAYPAKSGMVILLDDGRRIRARAVETAAYRRWLRDDTPADEIADDVLTAADRARDGRPPALADAQVVGRNAIRRRNAVFLRLALGVLLAALVVYSDAHSSDSQHSRAASHSTPSLRIGECFTSSDIPSASTAVSCAAPHTSQIFAVSRTSPTGTCDSSLIISSALPPDASNETVYLIQNGVPTTLCLVVTASITRSVVQIP